MDNSSKAPRFVVFIYKGKNHAMVHVIDGCPHSHPAGSYDGSMGWAGEFDSYHNAKAYAQQEVPKKHDIRLCGYCSKRASS